MEGSANWEGEVEKVGLCLVRSSHCCKPAGAHPYKQWGFWMLDAGCPHRHHRILLACSLIFCCFPPKIVLFEVRSKIFTTVKQPVKLWRHCTGRGTTYPRDFLPADTHPGDRCPSTPNRPATSQLSGSCAAQQSAVDHRIRHCEPSK